MYIFDVFNIGIFCVGLFIFFIFVFGIVYNWIVVLLLYDIIASSSFDAFTFRYVFRCFFSICIVFRFGMFYICIFLFVVLFINFVSDVGDFVMYSMLFVCLFICFANGFANILFSFVVFSVCLYFVVCFIGCSLGVRFWCILSVFDFCLCV